MNLSKAQPPLAKASSLNDSAAAAGGVHEIAKLIYNGITFV